MPAGLRAVQRRHRRGTFTPLQLPGLLGWHKADAIVGLNDGDVVGTWVDSSGLGHNATQSTASAKPLYKTGIINGLPVARYDTTDQLNAPSYGAMSQPIYLFVVAKITSSAANKFFIDTAAGSRIYASCDNLDKLDVNATNDVKGTAGAVVGAFHVIEFVWNGASSVTTIDGVTDAGPANAGSNTPTQIIVGKLLNGDLAEWIFCAGTTLGSVVRQNTRLYLGAKYALTTA